MAITAAESDTPAHVWTHVRGWNVMEDLEKSG
jgi:hypothetical protein